MKTISFEKLRAQFWDASFELQAYHSHCIGFHYDFKFDFTPLTIKRAWENLDRAKRFVAKLRPEYPAGDRKRCLDRLDNLIAESYAKIVIETATEKVSHIPPAVAAVDVNDDFLF